jgi:predicted glycosyltransferase involved in capsule biosynthesis
MQLQDMTNQSEYKGLYDGQQDDQLSSDKKSCPINQLLTIVMPVRVDSEERKANLKAVLSHISKLGCRILVLEADSEAKLQNEDWVRLAEYIFVKDDSPVFHRTKFINQLLHKAGTDIVSVWDADILVPYDQVIEAVSLILRGYTIAYPYNGEYVMLSEQESGMARQMFDAEHLKSRRMQSIFGRPFCGGVFLVHRKRYLDCGGENERFTGWGPEDAERLRRVCILGHKVSWTSTGQAYHLNHPRGKNSDFYTNDVAIRLRKELAKVCSMNKEQLCEYINALSFTEIQ